MSMAVSNVGTSYDTQYASRPVESAQEKTQAAPEEDRKNLGVILELSKDSELAKSLAEKVRQRNENGERYAYPKVHRTTSGDNAKGMVNFYGASVTKEQSEGLQSVIKELEEQGKIEGMLYEGWEMDAYAGAGLRVSQLSYACKEMGISEEAAKQITGTYGKQAEERINWLCDMQAYAREQVVAARKELYKKYGTPQSIAEANKVKEDIKNTDDSTVTAIPNKKEQKDIFSKFASLDVRSKDAFKSSFDAAMNDVFYGTNRQQLSGLMKMYQKFMK